MRNLHFVILGFALVFSGTAKAANTLDIAACSAETITFSWTVDRLDAAPFVTAADLDNINNSHQFILFARTGTVTVDFAGKWNGSNNRRVQLTLATTPPLVRVCP